MTPFDKRSWLRIAAKVAMAEFPQFNGVFDDVILCKIKGDVVTKGGLAFEDGEHAIRKNERPSPIPGMGGRFYSVWSARNRCFTSIPSALVQDVAI